MLTKKDFRAIAAEIALADVSDATRRIMADSLARYCATQNPRFDRAKFLAACGVQRQTVQS